VILGLGALPGLKKFRILIEFELWRRSRKMGLWGLRRGEPVRKVEGEIEVKMMEDGGRRKERGVGERDGLFWIIISCWEATVLPNCSFPRATVASQG
jgi:hypothetical protein